MAFESPVESAREALQQSKEEMAGLLCLSGTQYHLLKQGAFEQLPAALLKLMDEHVGEGAGSRLAEDYRKFREELEPEALSALENRLWPAGRVYGMCP